jgi:hypothetical protein
MNIFSIFFRKNEGVKTQSEHFIVRANNDHVSIHKIT